MVRSTSGRPLSNTGQSVDGANSPNSPNAPVGTREERAAAYSLLLAKGLIRVGLPMPAGAEFELVAVDDPYGFASAAEVSLFRRPLPTTNLRFQVALMWDGRETPIEASCRRASGRTSAR